MRRCFVVAFLVMAACRSPQAARESSPTAAKAGAALTPAREATEAPGEVLAEVNSVPITRQELLAENVQGAAPSDQALLFAVVQKELAAQRAQALGLAADPEYENQMRQKEAELTAFKRKQLAALLYRREVQAKASVSDAEVQQYFENNRGRIGKELHLLQIFERDRTRIDGAQSELEKGRDFVEVARELAPPGHPGASWDLGFQRYAQMPAAWLDVVYALRPGQRSGVIEGPNHRYWILQLVDARDVDAPLDVVRESLRTLLQGRNLDQLSKALEADLLKDARVVYRTGAP